MKDTYFVYNGIKYVVVYGSEDIKIFKDSNGEKEKLSSMEEKEIEDLLNSDYGYIYNDIISELVNSNSNIDKKEYIINLLKQLENNIPEEFRDNFYRNIKTLSTSLQQETEISINDEKPKNLRSASYDVKENKLVIEKSTLGEIWRRAQKEKNPEDAFLDEYNRSVMHELLHMASTKYDREKNIGLCGFDKFPTENMNCKNKGLTEGYTEMLAYRMTNAEGKEISSGYNVEIFILKQLIQLIGEDVIFDSYFTNIGIILLESKLHEIINDANISYKLFRDIELNFKIRRKSEKDNVLGNIQTTLLNYLDNKLAILLKNNKVEEANELLNNYEKNLFTSENMKKMTSNSEKYEGIEESAMKYYIIKDKYSQYIAERLGGFSI